MVVPDIILPQLLRDSVARFADRPCLDFMGRGWRYREVGALVSRAAKGLAALGIGRGKRVALVLPNTPYYVILYYAILETGGTVVNVNPLYMPREIRQMIEDAGAELIVTLDLPLLFGKVAALADAALGRRVLLCRMAGVLPFRKGVAYRLLKRREQARPPLSDAIIDFAAVVANDGVFSPPVLDPARDIALLQYTGGTTGTPKGAMLTHRNLVANVRQCMAWFPGTIPGAERVVAVLPFFHVFAMTVALNVPIGQGAEITLLPRFDLDSLLEAFRRKRPTSFAGVPTLFGAICNDPRGRNLDLRAIRYLSSGGAPLPLEVKSRFEALAGCPILEGYGLSETSPVVTTNPPDGINKAGSVGLPVPGTDVRICGLDVPSKILPNGERGEVVVRGPQVMAGYWRNPEATAKVLSDGWFRTGDVGFLDSDGYLFLVDRIKDVIIAGGYKIYPRNVEEAIYQHPGVAECIVVGVPDPYRGQTVKAYIATRQGYRLDPDELRSFLKDRLSPIEMPKQIEFRDSLPKTLIGKPSRTALLHEEAERLSGASPAAPT